jgi:hypothetical protein
MIQIKHGPPDPALRLLLAVAAVATAAEWLGPVLAAGLGGPLLRIAAGHSPSPTAGAVEAGVLASATWLVFEA